jgi:hypothetical protein
VGRDKPCPYKVADIEHCCQFTGNDIGETSY